MLLGCSQQLSGQSKRLLRTRSRATIPHCRLQQSRNACYNGPCTVRTERCGISSPPTARIMHASARNVRVHATPFIQSSATGKSGIIYLAGATGLISIRLLRDLAASGFKIVAGVPDEQEANIIKDFFTRFEIISKNVCENILIKEVPAGGVDALAATIPKGARVLIVDNDASGKLKTDARAVTSVVQAASAAGASQVILLTPLQGDSGTSFFLFGQPSASSKASNRLTKLEQQVVDSGLPFTIVRVAGLASVKEPAETRSALVGPVGTYAPASPPLPRDLLGEVLAAVLVQGSQGSVLEVVPNTEATEAAPVAEQISKAVASLRAAEAEVAKEAELQKAVAQAARTVAGRSAQSSKKEEEPEPAKPAPLPALFKFGAPKKAAEPEVAEPEPEAPKKAPAPLFGFGARKPAPAKEVEEEKEEPAPKPAPLFAFGARKAPPKAPEPEEEPAPKKPAPLFAFGARKAPAKAQEPEEEEEAPKKAAPLFAFGTRKVVKQEPEAAPAGKTGRTIAKAVPVKPGQGTQRGTQVQKASPAQRGTQAQSKGTQIQKGTQRGGSQKVVKAAPAPKKAPPPPTKKPVPAKKAPPARGSKKGSASDDEEEPPKKGFRLFPL